MFEIDPDKYDNQLKYYSINYLITGILAIIVSFIAMTNSEESGIRFLGIFLGIFIIYITVFKFKEAYETRNYVNMKAKRILINAVLLFILGIFFIFFPNLTIDYIARGLGIVLLISSINSYIVKKVRNIFDITFYVIRIIFALLIIINPQTLTNLIYYFIIFGFLFYGIYKIIFGLHLHNILKNR